VVGFYLIAAILMLLAVKRLQADWVDDEAESPSSPS
jgi:hypothetical protein